MNNPKARYLIDIELLEDADFDPDAEYIMLRANHWRVIESWLRVCKKAGVMGDGYQSIVDTTIWPLTFRRHAEFDA